MCLIGKSSSDSDKDYIEKSYPKNKLPLSVIDENPPNPGIYQHELYLKF